MLIIAFFVGVVFFYYFLRLIKYKIIEGCSEETMAESEPEAVRCSSSDSDNFEKIDSEDVRRESNGENPHFTVGEGNGDGDPSDVDTIQEDGPAHEGGDYFPNFPPPNLKPKLTVAQQLALAEKRSRLKGCKGGASPGQSLTVNLTCPWCALQVD